MSKALTEYKGVKAELDSFGRMNGFLANLIIEEDTIAQEASDNLRMLKVMVRQIDKQRKKITQPIDQAKRAVMQQYREAIAPINEAITLIQSKLTTYQVDKRRREEEEQRMLLKLEAERLQKIRDEQIEQAEMNQSELAMDDAIATQQQINEVVNVEIGGSGLIKKPEGRSTSSLIDRYRFNVSNLSEVPTMYLMINESLVNKVINGKNRIKEIPGIKIWNDPYLTTRGR